METASEESRAEEQHVNRRTFFGYVFGAIAAFLTAALGIPLAGAAILPTLKQRERSWVSAGALGEYQVGQPKSAQLMVTVKDGWVSREEPKGIWVIKRSDNDFTVYNGRCVHLGCAYNWVEGQQRFVCPCHGGIYTLDGKVVGGPPPRPLDTLEWKVEQGNLMVAYTDFRLGVPGKEAI